MPQATSPAPPQSFVVDPVLVNAIVHGVESALTMCRRQARCVAIARIPTRDPGLVTGLVGVHGEVSGFVTVNMAEKSAISLVAALLEDHFESLTNQVIDGVGEIANIITGGIKQRLLGTPWAFHSVTVPSVIVGRNYQIAYAKGIEYLSATFEQQDSDAVLLDDRLIQVAISLIRL